jgi:hypothetical protein
MPTQSARSQPPSRVASVMPKRFESLQPEMRRFAADSMSRKPLTTNRRESQRFCDLQEIVDVSAIAQANRSRPVESRFAEEERWSRPRLFS